MQDKIGILVWLGLACLDIAAQRRQQVRSVVQIAIVFGSVGRVLKQHRALGTDDLFEFRRQHRSRGHAGDLRVGTRNVGQSMAESHAGA